MAFANEQYLSTATKGRDMDDDWRAKSPDASRIGTAVEYLVAATCILASRGVSHPGSGGGPDARMIFLVEGRTSDGTPEEVPAGTA